MNHNTILADMGNICKKIEKTNILMFPLYKIIYHITLRIYHIYKLSEYISDIQYTKCS